jgi:hypothetical protein
MVHIHQDRLWEDASHVHLAFDLFIDDVRAIFVLENGRVIVTARADFDREIRRQRETTYIEGNQIRGRLR